MKKKEFKGVLSRNRGFCSWEFSGSCWDLLSRVKGVHHERILVPGEITREKWGYSLELMGMVPWPKWISTPFPIEGERSLLHPLW